MLYHYIVEYDYDVTVGKKAFVNKYYDEIIFHEPCQFFYQLLTNSKPLTNGVYKHGTDCKNSLGFQNFFVFKTALIWSLYKL